MAGARNALNGPAHRTMPKRSAGMGGFPTDIAPSLDLMGNGLQDHRVQWNKYNNNQATGKGIIGWYGASNPRVIDVVPSTLGPALLAPLAHVVSGTPMTLVTSSALGVTVLAAATLVWPSRVTIPAGALVIDGTPAQNNFGSGFVSSFYDPSTMLSRSVSATGVSAGSGGTLTVNGWDVYGYAMTQTLTLAAGVNTVNTLKAFKYIGSIVPNFSDANNVSIGYGDVVGLPLYASKFSNCGLVYNSAAVFAATGFIAGVTTNPSTAALGDVRGTYALQSASDGTKRLILNQYPDVPAMVTNPTTGLFGQPQV